MTEVMQVKKLTESAVMPVRGSRHAAGEFDFQLDFVCCNFVSFCSKLIFVFYIST